jgi:tRNA A37 methylthiotransferase MiaB
MFILIEEEAQRHIILLIRIKQVIINLFQAGINLKTYFIFGFPNETIKDFEMTYDLACNIKKESIKYNVKLRTSVFQYRPYHGTELYEKMKNQSNFEILKTVHNQHLSSMIGRMQFNFQSGNYSNVDDETLHHFIQKTLNLNNI